MNDKLFELQQYLIKSQDSFKNAIMIEADVEKHISIIDKFTKEETQLSEKIVKEFEKLVVVEVIEEKKKRKEKK